MLRLHYDPRILTSAIIVAVGAWLTVPPLANTLGFVPLRSLYYCSGHHAAGLCDSDTGGEDLVRSPVWRLRAVAAGKKVERQVEKSGAAILPTSDFILQKGRVTPHKQGPAHGVPYI
jgi:hypothetical protein